MGTKAQFVRVSPKGTNENGALVIFQSSLAGLWEFGFIKSFPEMEFLGYFQMSLRDKIPDVVLT
jgi:hypothetical protein